MPELSVVIVATDNEQRAVLQVLVDGTSVARTVHTCASFPVAASDPVTRRVRAANPDVTLVDIPADLTRGDYLALLGAGIQTVDQLWQRSDEQLAPILGPLVGRLVSSKRPESTSQ